MKPWMRTGRENKADPRWLLASVGLLVLAAALVLFLSSTGPNSSAHGIVVLATWFSNGEQVVTFRCDPPNAEVTFADVVSVSDDGSAQPATVRVSSNYLGGFLVPVQIGGQNNTPLRYVALPTPGASIKGTPVAYTPGSYTVAYSPSASANRIRVGVAPERKGLADWGHRLWNCWQQNNLVFLRANTHEDPLYVTSEPITNLAPDAAQQVAPPNSHPP
jgi:hypothetical protein